MSEPKKLDVAALETETRAELVSNCAALAAALTSGRDAAGLSLDDIARRVDVPKRHVKRWFTGALLPGPSDLRQLSVLLGLDPEALADAASQIVSAERTLVIITQAADRQKLVLRQLEALASSTAKVSGESTTSRPMGKLFGRRQPHNRERDAYYGQQSKARRKLDRREAWDPPSRGDYTTPGQRDSERGDGHAETPSRPRPDRDEAPIPAAHLDEPTDEPATLEPAASPEEPVMTGRARVFLGSSTEGMNAARALQVLLDHECEVEIWNQGTFAPGATGLGSLVQATTKFDFAILVVTADDTTSSRGEKRLSPRDNVIFELGLFMGALRPERTFMVQNRASPSSLPSDLAGVTPVTWAPHTSGNMAAALGSAATQILQVIERIGRR